MERDSVHELTAAYALHALDERDVAAYEAHLAQCPDCRAELASFQETAGSLAYGAPAADPPDALRDRILSTARAERENVVPFAPRRRATAVFASAAAIAATVAVILGVWAVSLSSSLDDERTARAADAEALAIMAQPGATAHAVEGGSGYLVVAPGGDAALVLSDLEAAPEGKTYEAWVSPDGKAMEAAGTFQGGGDTTAFRLSQAVPENGLVAVTLEDAGGSDQPTGDPFLIAPTA